MKLFLITDEFNKSSLERSFRATVIAHEENSARWLVGQRSRAFQIADVAAAAVFCIGDIAHETEGVLTVVHDNGAQQLSYSQYQQPKLNEEMFFEVEILDRSILPYRDRSFRGESWFAPRGNPDYLLRRAELGMNIRIGEMERNIIIHQTVKVDVNRKDQWRYIPAGESYKTQIVDFHQASLLELRSHILRAAASLPGEQSADRELRRLWGYVSETAGDGAVEVTDLAFYPGQKLWWQADEARAWVSTLPQIVSVETTVDGDTLKDIPGTNCQG